MDVMGQGQGKCLPLYLPPALGCLLNSSVFPIGAFQSFSPINGRCWRRPRHECLPCLASVTICRSSRLTQQDRRRDFTTRILHVRQDCSPTTSARKNGPEHAKLRCASICIVDGRMQRQSDATSLITHV